MPSTMDRRLGFGSVRKRWLLYGVSSFDRLLSLTSLPPVSVYCLKVHACLTEFCKCFLPEGGCLPYGVFSCKCLLPDGDGLPYDSSCKCLLPEGERLPYGVSFCSSWLMFFYGVCFCFDVLIMISSSYLKLSICDRACDVNCERDNSNLAVIQTSDFFAIL
jgi:hypothetical protein